MSRYAVIFRPIIFLDMRYKWFQAKNDTISLFFDGKSIPILMNTQIMLRYIWAWHQCTKKKMKLHQCKVHLQIQFQSASQQTNQWLCVDAIVKHPLHSFRFRSLTAEKKKNWIVRSFFMQFPLYRNHFNSFFFKWISMIVYHKNFDFILLGSKLIFFSNEFPWNSIDLIITLNPFINPSITDIFFYFFRWKTVKILKYGSCLVSLESVTTMQTRCNSISSILVCACVCIVLNPNSV